MRRAPRNRPRVLDVGALGGDGNLSQTRPMILLLRWWLQRAASTGRGVSPVCKGQKHHHENKGIHAQEVLSREELVALEMLHVQMSTRQPLDTFLVPCQLDEPRHADREEASAATSGFDGP